MSVILPKIPARLRRMLGRFVGPAGAALFSLVLASCAGGGFGGAPDTPAVNPASQLAPVASGPISPASQRNVAEALSGLKLGDETPPISPEDIAVSDDAEILNRNPFSSSAPAARASGWGARADSTRKTQGYKAFEVAVPSENPLMTVAVWISETPPDYPEGKPEQDPESDRKFLYLRLQVFIAVRHVALVEGGGIEVLDSEVIVVEEKRPDPKPQPACGTGEFRDGEGSCAPILGADLLCPSGTMPANGLTQEELDAGLFDAGQGSDDNAWKVCEYLRRGANIHATDVQDFSPILRAFQSGFSLPLKVLAANGANVNDRQPPARLYSLLDSAAFWISRGKNLPLYGKKALILREAGATCHYLDPQQYPACLGSSDSGSVPVATPDPVTLEAVTAETVCESGSLSANGLTQAQLDAGLISAAEGNDLAGACEYLRRGANVDARESGRYYKRTALMIATTDGRLELAKLLYANGADVNLDGGNHDGYDVGRGWTALQYSGAAGRPELAGWLLDSGAELNSEWVTGKTALWEAAYWGRPDVVKLLLSRGAETNGGGALLHAAVLLDEGGWVSARRYWANGPAFRYKRNAISYSYPIPTANEHGQVVSLLLSHDAEVNARYQGRSPLDYAARQGDERLSAMLRDAGGICYVETGPLCGVVEVATPDPVTLAVTAETVCESGSLSANGLTQAQLDSGLISAARDNDLEGVCEHLRRGANIEAQESEWRYHKRTALMIAATDNSLDLAKLLRANGADVNRQGGNYHNGIDSAAPSSGNRKVSALHYAAGAGHKDFVEWLLAEGADLHAKQTIKRDALWEAAFWGRADIVKLFLSLGANVHVRDVWGATPFLDAAHFPTYLARHGRPRWGILDTYALPSDSDWVTVLSLLVSSGADVNVRYNSGSSALDVAVSRGNAEYAELLRGYGVRCFVQTGPLCGSVPVATPDPVTLEAATAETVCESGSLSTNGLTQAELDAGLLSAARDNDLEGVCEHLRRGADIEAQESEWRYHKRTALMIAATDNSLDLAKLLRANGADVNRQGGNYHNGIDSAAPSSGNRKVSALHYAAGAGHKDFVEWLLAEGADLHAKQTIKRDALWEAAFWGRADIVKLFLSLGANVHVRDVWGATPFLDAAHFPTYLARHGRPRWGILDTYALPSDSDWVTVLSLLVSSGADVNVRYNSGSSALDVAVSRGNAEYAELLRGYGVRCFVQTGPLCGVVEVATPDPVTLEAVTAETVCESGSLSTNGLTQAELDAGLLSAARDNDLEGVCEHLRRGADIEAQESEWRYHKRTALMIAATDNSLDLAKLLRANGADVNRQGGNYHNGIDSAAPSSGNRKVSALHYAAGAGHKDFVEWLLAEGADLHAKQTIKRDALWEAAFWGRADIVKLFLSLGANVHVRDVWGATPFLDAAHFPTYLARHGRPRWGILDTYALPSDSDWVTVLSLLVSSGADVNVRYNSGSSALDVAVSRGNAEYAELLRGYGVRCFVQTGPLCGVDVAVDFSSSGLGTVSAEGDGGALSDGDEVRQGATVMFTATPAAGHYVSGWSGNCAEIGDVADGLDGTAKSCAVSADSDLSVRAEFSEIPSLAGLLCESGSLSANGLTTAELNMTLRLAARGGDATRVCEALRRGAEVNDNLDDSEFTPLQEAVSGGHLEAAKVLLANGAEVNKRKDGAGRSPLDLAARDGEAEIAALLRNADGRCFVETGPLCQSVPVATPDPVTVVNTVAATVASTVVATVANTVVAEVENTVASTVAAGSCPAGTLPTNGLTQAQLDYEFLGAVLENDLEGACEYLRRGANIEIREDEVGRPHNLSALMIAAGRGGYNYPDMTRLLLANGAKTDARDGSGWVTALHIAAVSDHTETAALILDWGGDVNVLSSAGDPPLYQAAHWGRADMVRLLLSRGADPDIQADTGVSPLHGAASNVARSGSAAVVSLLLSYGADPNPPRSRSNPGLITRAGETGHSPLDDLVARGYGNYAEAARILRDAGGKCFVRTSSLCQNVPVATPDPVTVVNTVAATVVATVVATVANTVVAAVENTVAATVAAGSCPAGTLPTNGLTQAQLDDGFLGAALENDVEEVCNYLRRGANIEIRTDQVGRPHHRSEESATALMIAGRNNYSDLARLLLSNGADVDSTGGLAGGGWSALHIAAYEDHADVARVLLDGGADPDVDTGFDHSSFWTPLHEAAYYNHWRIMKILLTSGANSNIQTTRPGWRGGAPLHYVFDGTRSGSALAVSVLVAGDADVNLRDSGGNSALDLAANRGDAASAEILRAAGGQCFVSTSSLCGSAPAPAAAAAESAPATDRLRESFAGAFNPSPAFGDAFGATSGSSQRFLSRLDSLMRSTSGSGGNAWDSFAGWQTENEHGRMWFSTGQRGDFGFGADVGGAGGDLSASPFAAMVGNGMLAGGETGLGADGKLRIAAFADYQARSLLDGTDRQWTKWAASGTAIETAMTEAERFSGLAENQTRGAMTEIHLGGGDLGVALQAGAVSESDAMLSGTAGDESLRGLRARTAFAGLSGAADLFGSGWRLRGSAHLGRSWAESESMLQDGDLWASAFSAGLERGGWLYSDDGFVLRFSQPLRVESLEMELIGEGGASRLGADPSGRQLDVDAAYRLPLSGGGWLLLSAGVRRDGGHTSSSDLEAGALFSVERGF